MDDIHDERVQTHDEVQITPHISTTPLVPQCDLALSAPLARALSPPPAATVAAAAAAAAAPVQTNHQRDPALSAALASSPEGRGAAAAAESSPPARPRPPPPPPPPPAPAPPRFGRTAPLSPSLVAPPIQNPSSPASASASASPSSPVLPPPPPPPLPPSLSRLPPPLLPPPPPPVTTSTFPLATSPVRPSSGVLPAPPAPPAPPPPSTPPQPPPQQLPQHHLHLTSMPKMIFSDLYKSPKSPFSKLRNHHHIQQQQQQQHEQASQLHHTGDGQAGSDLWDYGDPDLVSRDKSRQKEAVRRYLAEKIRSDWCYAWEQPQQTPEAAAAAAALRAKLVRSEQIGLLEPLATFASPLPATTTTTATATMAAAASSSSTSSSPSSPSSPAVLPSHASSTSNSEDPSRGDGHVEAEHEDTAAAVAAGPVVDHSDAESVYSTVSEDAIHFRPRAEWTSDVSDDETRTGQYYQRMPTYVHSPFRFDNPESLGAAAASETTKTKTDAAARKAQVRRDLRAESLWNEGLACFTARRDAWTGARTVHLKPAKPLPSSSPPTSPVSPRRGLFRFHSHSKSEPAPAVTVPTAASTFGHGTPLRAASPPTTTMPAITTPLTPVVTANSRHSQQSQQSQQSHHSQHSQHSVGQDTVATTPLTSDGNAGVDGASPLTPLPRASCAYSPRTSPPSPPAPRPTYATETLLPVAPPLLPPANPMRASIVPGLYLSLYDKVVQHSLQPSCPINLRDMMRACVAGWKRDGEWPPRPAAPATAPSAPVVSAVVDVVRKKQRDERRRDAQKLRRMGTAKSDTAAPPLSPPPPPPPSGLPSPPGRRRMSVFLGRPSSIGVVVPPATTSMSVTAAAAGAAATTGTANGGPASPSSPTGAEEKNSNDDGTGVGGSSRGIRRSLQRVLLGFGSAANAHNGGGGGSEAGKHAQTHSGHGHSLSVGSIGPVGAAAKEK